MSLKLLLNNKEIANFLMSYIDIKAHIRKIPMNMSNTADTIIWIRTGLNKIKKGKKLDSVVRKKYKDKILKSVGKDMRSYLFLVEKTIEYRREYYWKLIHERIDYILEKMGEEYVLDLYKKSQQIGFVKGCGFSIDPNGTLIRRHRFNSYTEDCLIRNTVGNEELLINKIDKKLPFWFIDSGYTNFLEPNKKWHRLVRGHLHYGNFFDAPVDRLGNFKSFPKKWRSDGEIISVIEPGPFAADIFHVDLKTWKYKIEEEIRKYSDKKIKFREKFPKKTRTNLYQELLDEDFYCLININSNAATEAIWAGIPVITLDKHVTNPVSRNKISDINDLWKGNLCHWLCMLSYSQFTYEEITNGFALGIVKEYHE